jgi:hypothetical protein
MKAAISIGVRVLVLTAALFVCFAVAGRFIIGNQDIAQTPEQAGVAAVALLAACFLNTVVLAHIVLRSSWAGWRLVAAVFFVFYGVTTFMSQIETAVFVTRLPPGMLPRLFLAGVLTAAPFSVLAVLVLGKWKADVATAEPNSRRLMPTVEWAWRLAAIAVAYLALYFTFGYFIVWRNPAALEYYAGVDEGSFSAHMGTVLTETFWLIPFQLIRAMLWVAIALPVIRMMKGPWQQTAFALGLLFAVVMSAWLLLPNPYMPEAVRMAHLIEVASSNFIFGLLVGWLLRSKP